MQFLQDAAHNTCAARSRARVVRSLAALAITASVAAQFNARQVATASSDTPPTPSGINLVTATPGRGFYSADTVVTLAAASATGIRYTLDGSNPCSSGTAVTDTSVTITRTTVLRAASDQICGAAAGGAVGSLIKPISSFTYIFTAKVATQNNAELINDFGFPKFWARPATSQTLRTPQFCNWPDEGVPRKAEVVPNTPAGNAKLECPFLADYDIDPDVVPGLHSVAQFEQAMRSIPSVSISTDHQNLWYRGPYSNTYNPAADYGIIWNSNEKYSTDPLLGFRPDPYPGYNRWERPISIEWISPTNSSGSTTVNWFENAGIRIHGQASRNAENTPKKTFRVYFAGSRYGTPKLDFQLFDDNDAAGKFDRIILRNGGNRSIPYHDRDQRREADYVNDELARQTWIQMGYLAPNGGTYVHLYINGAYWGLYNVTERIDEKMVQSYLGGDETNYDLISADEDYNDEPRADSGTINAYNELFTFGIGTSTPTSYTDAPLSDANYQALKARINLTEFADYIIHNHWIGKTDWPNHNWNAYRPRTGADTRFRWMQWDIDSGFNKFGENTSLRNENALDAPYDSPMQIFFRLSTHPEFKQLLTDRVYKHAVAYNGVLNTANCRAVYTELTGKISQAIIGESARWGDYSRDFYHRLEVSPDKSWPAYLYTKSFNYASVVSNSLPYAFGPTQPHNGIFLKASDMKNWDQVVASKLNNQVASDSSDSTAGYCLNRPSYFAAHYKANGWYNDAVMPPTYTNKLGGAVALNFPLNIKNLNAGFAGDLYYTTDGSDPRLEGGSVNPLALAGGDEVNVTISRVMNVKARVLSNGVWSALMDYTFYPPQPLSTNLVINEIHYSPSRDNAVPGTATWAADEDHWEYVELVNRGTVPLQLDNLYFFRGISYRFPPNTTLYPGQYYVVASEPSRFSQRYPAVTLNGDYRGNLSNSGETIELRDAVGNVIDVVTFQNGTFSWPALPVPPAPVTGRSLELKNPATDNNVASNWAVPGTDPGGISDQAGTPGRQNRAFNGNLPPAVTVTAPLTGSVINIDTPFTLDATVSDNTGVAYVEFWVNNTKVASDTTAPYSIPFTPTTVGAYSVFAVAIDTQQAGNTSTANQFSIVSARPVVTITAPGPAQVLPQGVPYTVTALATDSDSTIASVTMYANGVALCSDSASPYECVWQPIRGTYTLTATAVDTTGQIGVSQPRAVTVANAKPLVSIAVPTNGSTVALGSPTKITALTSDIDGSVASVSFRVNNVELCNITAPPFECLWTPAGAPQDVFTILAIATDNEGEQATSTPVVVVGITNTPPVVNLTAPSAAQAGTVVNLSASATPSGRPNEGSSITSVTFFVDGQPVCVDTTAPYTCDWTPQVAKTYSVIAVATDNLGTPGSSTSASVVVAAVAPRRSVHLPLLAR